MSLSNEVRLVGFCADKPQLKITKQGVAMTSVVVYTQDYIKEGKPLNQAHRCVFFGSQAGKIAKFSSKGRHIHLRGSLRSQRKGKGADARYYTSILVEEFKVSPRQSMAALEDTVREILDKNQITSYEDLNTLSGKQ